MTEQERQAGVIRRAVPNHFLITGGAGFIGSHLIEQLLADGHRVTVVDNLMTGRLENLPQSSRLKLLQKNILRCQPEDFPDPIDGIAHLAATPSVTESWLNPIAVHDNNLSSTIAVISLCKALKIPKLVFASSAAVYGTQTQLPITEDRSTHPISPYGLQKLASEQYAQLFAQEFGFSFVGLRLFNVFGPRQLPNSQYSGVISIFTQAMQSGLPITIYGDGKQTRDFIYVRDVAGAFAKALLLPMSQGSSLICNVGTGQETSLLELVDILKVCCGGWQGGLNFAIARLGDIQQSLSDISRLRSQLEFTPQWSVESGLKMLVSGLQQCA
jgi:UDP-glucose 4-epimerase